MLSSNFCPLLPPLKYCDNSVYLFFSASFDLKIIDGGNNDIRIVGVVTILVLILICCVGMEWESKAQNFLIVTIVLAIFNFLIGVAIGPGDDKERIAKGFVGFRSTYTIQIISNKEFSDSQLPYCS